MSTVLAINVNAPLQPIHRGERFEDPLQEALDLALPGSEVVGGGTMLSADKEVTSCDIDLEVPGDPHAARQIVIDTLHSLGLPKGSKVRVGDDTVECGVFEGLALYLNGTDLDMQVYETNDINELIQQLLDALGSEGALYSWWRGPTETALYLYGPSADRMRELISGVLAAHPLAQRSRLVTRS